MAVGQPSILHHGPHRGTQVQQTQGVGHGGAGLAHPLGALVLGHAVLLRQHPVALGLFDGVQILPLEVLDHGQLHGLAVVGLDDHGGHLCQPGHPRRPPPPLAGDDLIIPALQLPHRQRLDDAVYPDGVRQIAERLRVEALAGLGGAALHLTDGQQQGGGAFVLGGDDIVAQQRAQSLAQTFCICHTASPFSSCFSAEIPPPAPCTLPRPGMSGRKRRWACRGWALR